MECALTNMWVKMSMTVRASPHRLFGSPRGCTQYSLGEKGLAWLFVEVYVGRWGHADDRLPNFGT